MESRLPRRIGLSLAGLVSLVASLAAPVGPARGAAPAGAPAPVAAHGRTAPARGFTGETPRYGSALPRFALFGWVSPPRESTTTARYAEMVAAGFNLTVLAWDDSGTVGDNRIRLDVTRPLGIRNLLLDNDLDSVSIAEPASLALADTIAARYRDDPAFLGYYMGDEPPASYFGRLGELFGILRERDPAHPSWNNLGPRGSFLTPAAFQAYVQAYVDTTHPAVICNDQYDFQVTGDTHQLTENVAVMGAVARAAGIPFWGIIQLVEHWKFRHVTSGMLRWQIAQWIAGGARGIGYFTYWTPAPDAYNWQPAMIEWGTGARTANYDTVAAINARLAPIGNTLAGCTWLGIEHAGYVPPGGVPFAPGPRIAAVDGRATLGLYADSTGAPYVFVANDDSLAARTVTLWLAAGWRAARLRDDGAQWDMLPQGAGGDVVLALDAGDYDLLRLGADPGTASVGGGARPISSDLRVAPNPAGGTVRFERTGELGAARLEVLDPGGRRVWSRALAPGTRELAWDGRDDHGGRAPAGVYFARLHDAHGSRTRRFAWLGRAR